MRKPSGTTAPGTTTTDHGAEITTTGCLGAETIIITTSALVAGAAGPTGEMALTTGAAEITLACLEWVAVDPTGAITVQATGVVATTSACLEWALVITVEMAPVWAGDQTPGHAGVETTRHKWAGALTLDHVPTTT